MSAATVADFVFFASSSELVSSQVESQVMVQTQQNTTQRETILFQVNINDDSCVSRKTFSIGTFSSFFRAEQKLNFKSTWLSNKVLLTDNP